MTFIRPMLLTAQGAALLLPLLACHPSPRETGDARALNSGGGDATSTGPGSSVQTLPLLPADSTPIAADGAALVVSGLACPKCASNVDVQLARLHGVQVRRVDMRHGLVLVAFAAQPHPASAQLAKAVTDAGLTWRGWMPLAPGPSLQAEPGGHSEAAGAGP